MSQTEVRESPSSAAVATASAAVAAALHGDDVREEVYALVEASVQTELEGVRRLNAVRRRFGRQEFVLEFGGLWHDCYGSHKPIPDPMKPYEQYANRYWKCVKLPDGCYACGFVEIVLKNKQTEP